MADLLESLSDHALIRFVEEQIDTQEALDFVNDEHCGGETMFIGTTRQWTVDPAGEKLETSHLIYEAYQGMALKQLEQICEQARSRWPVHRTAILHRLGRVEPREASVAIAVSTPHRSEAFEACHWLIDTLKHEVPIWKQEHYVQNGTEWIHPTSGSCRCEPKKPDVGNDLETNRTQKPAST